MTARRENLGSPIFPFSNTATIASGASAVFDFAQHASIYQKWAPFNFVVISNNSSQKIRVYLNQDTNKGMTIPASTIRTLDKKSCPALSSILVTNAGTGTIAIGELDIEVQKETIDSEQIIQKVARGLFQGAGI